MVTVHRKDRRVRRDESKRKLNEIIEKIRKIKTSQAIFCHKLDQDSLTLSVLGVLCGEI